MPPGTRALAREGEKLGTTTGGMHFLQLRGVEAEAAATRPLMCREASETKNYLLQNVKSAEVKKPRSQLKMRRGA